MWIKLTDFFLLFEQKQLANPRSTVGTITKFEISCVCFMHVAAANSYNTGEVDYSDEQIKDLITGF
jgi:hypothetical protein